MIVTRGLTRRFGDLVAVDRLNLSVSSGEIYGFLGPNGAGKTTTIKMLTGVMKPSSGEIEISGLNMDSAQMEIKRRIAVVPDEPRMYDNLKGNEFVRFIMDIYRLDKRQTSKRFEEIADTFGIDYLGKYISDYSHGMKQKLMVAIALMREPEVIFLDEPTVGLDAASARKLKDWLKVMALNGATVFMTTHVLEVAEKMCDRIGIIDNGTLIAEGSMDDLRASSGKSEYSLEELFLELTGNGQREEFSHNLGD